MPRRLSVHHQTHKKFEKLKSLSESIESELSLIQLIQRIQLDTACLLRVVSVRDDAHRQVVHVLFFFARATTQSVV